MKFPSFASLPKTYSKQLFIIMFWLLFWSTVWGSTSNGLLRKGFRFCALRLALWAKGSDFGRSFFHFEHRVCTLGVCALSCAPSKGSYSGRSSLVFGSRVRTLGTPTCHFQHRVRISGIGALCCAPSKSAACQTGALHKAQHTF